MGIRGWFDPFVLPLTTPKILTLERDRFKGGRSRLHEFCVKYIYFIFKEWNQKAVSGNIG
jgi:hypothetical protein